MGIVLGVGLIVGTQAARNGTLLWGLPLVFSLMLLTVILPATIRLYLLAGIAGFAIAVAIGLLRPNQGSVQPGSFDQTRIQAIVESDPKVRGDGVTAYVRWRFPDQSGSTSSFAFFPSTPSIGRHDRLAISGKYEETGLLFVTSMRIEQSAGRAELVRRDIRSSISRTVHTSVPGSPGTLALGLLIGDDSGLTEDERLAIRQSGLSHITAVSGWNVTLVIVSAGAFFAALRWKSWKLLAVQLVAISMYVWIVGLDPPVLRAALMGVAALVAIQLGRPVHTLSLLVLAAAMMVLVSPEALGSLSFQLSFLSMLGLIGAVTVSLRFERPVSLILAPAIATAAAAIATAPLLAMTFGTVSLGTVPANVLVTPLVPLATYGAALVAICGHFPIFASLIGIPVWVLCSLILWIAQMISSIPGSYWEFEPPGRAATTAIYFGLAAAAFPMFPEGRYLLRSAGEWASQFPAQAIITGMSIIVTLFIIVFVV